MKLGISGGTFDPVHYGHLRPLRQAADRIGWDRVLLMPARRQPFKKEVKTASSYDRYAMLAMATSREPLFEVSSLELEREGVSYTVDTLELIRSSVGRDARIDWIIGDDNLPRLREWKSLERIFELANFVVLTRRGDENDLASELRSRVAAISEAGKAGSIVFFENQKVEISSTEVRRRVSEGKPITDLVPEPVEGYVRKYGLYR